MIVVTGCIQSVRPLDFLVDAISSLRANLQISAILMNDAIQNGFVGKLMKSLEKVRYAGYLLFRNSSAELGYRAMSD